MAKGISNRCAEIGISEIDENDYSEALSDLISKYYLILPEDIKIYIWNISHLKQVIQCFICNKVLLPLQIDIRENFESEYFIQQNNLVKCINC